MCIRDSLYVDGTQINVSSSFIKVGSILYNTNRYAGQVQFDNILLNCRVESAYAARSAFDDATDIEEAKTTVNPVAYYTLAGRRIAQPESGCVYIVKMSDGTARKLKF